MAETVDTEGQKVAFESSQEFRRQITREDIQGAIAALDRNEPHAFGPSTFYDLLEGGRRYPPKAVIGLAARRTLGRPLDPDEFSGGEESWAFRLLRERGFTIVDKERTSKGETLSATGGIRSTDPGVMERCRATGTAWVELAPEDREAYERVHNNLLEIAEAATAVANRSGTFKYSLTSGFTLKSGVRGSQPKDLWVAIHRADAPMGMPQLYMIVSARGVEYGFAPAIHPSDFSSQSYKEKLRAHIPSMFAVFPSADSATVREISKALDTSSGWYYRRKTRQDPFQNSFKDFEAVIGFLHSSEGLQWGAAAVCRYISPDQLDDPSLDLKRTFMDVVEIFAGLLVAMPVPAGNLQISDEGDQESSLPVQVFSLQQLLERFLQRFGALRISQFRKDEELWNLMHQLNAGLARLPALKKRPQIKIKWSVGQGNWAGIPWIAFLDQAETKTTQKGVYGVLLFREDLSGVYLTLNQGVTEVTDQHPKIEARKILRERANQYGLLVPELKAAGFNIDADIDLKTEGDLGINYEASTIACKLYTRGAIPSDDAIAADLEALLASYQKVLLAKGASRRSWIFQANPQRYDIDGALAELDELSWLINQHPDHIHEGDEVFLWRSGPQGGVVGTATILTEPAEFEVSPEDAAFNRDAEKFEGAKKRVRLQVDKVIDPPILRTAIAEDPSLSDLQILRMAQSTNSPVTIEQSRSLWRLISKNEQETGNAVAPSQKVWLVAAGQNAGRWEDFFRNGYVAIGWTRLGDLSRFKSREEIAEELQSLGSETSSSNNAASCFDFAHSMQEGDLVLVKKGRHSIVGYGIIVGPYYYDASLPDYRNKRSVRWQGRGNWNLDRTLALKAVTNITMQTEFVEKIKQQIGIAASTEESEQIPAAERKPFTIDDALIDLFLRKEEVEELVRTWRSKKNLILQGPPGVGKTFVAQRLAYALMGFEDESRVRRVQFHQSYSYEDFIQGYRPMEGGFERKDGLFFEFVQRAIRDDANNYVFIIDEINRGNLSKIFGELMVLIEPDKRDPKWAVPLTYAKKADEQFYVPKNLYILGMMNTADRSLSLVDYALRRRFAFFNLKSQLGSQLYKDYLASNGVPDNVSNAIISRVVELNQFISDREKSTLGHGFCIGHSFFMPIDDSGSWDESWYRRIVETELMPLLEEYWFENDDLIVEWRGRLLAAI